MSVGLLENFKSWFFCMHRSILLSCFLWVSLMSFHFHHLKCNIHVWFFYSLQIQAFPFPSNFELSILPCCHLYSSLSSHQLPEYFSGRSWTSGWCTVFGPEQCSVCMKSLLRQFHFSSISIRVFLLLCPYRTMESYSFWPADLHLWDTNSFYTFDFARVKSSETSVPIFTAPLSSPNSFASLLWLHHCWVTLIVFPDTSCVLMWNIF